MPTNCVELTTPVPPTLNHNIGARGKSRYMTAAYKDFLWSVAEEWARRRPSNWDASTRFEIVIKLHFATRRKCDIDNRIKPLLDALTRAGVWDDDAQVDAIKVRRGGVDKDNPRAEVTVYPLTATYSEETIKHACGGGSTP